MFDEEKTLQESSKASAEQDQDWITTLSAVKLTIGNPNLDPDNANNIVSLDSVDSGRDHRDLLPTVRVQKYLLY